MKFQSLSALPKPAQVMFEDSFERARSRGNTESSSAKIAWNVVKKRFKKQDGVWVAKSGAFQELHYYEFDMTPAEHFVTRSEDGEELHNFVLSDIKPDEFGTAPTVEFLQEWADTINKNQPAVDTDHSLYRTVLQQVGGNIDLVERALRAKEGIAKAVKAFVKNGKLIVSLAFDKRYARHIEKIKGASIEGMFKKDEQGRWNSGKFFGLSLLANELPGNPRAKRIIS